MSSAGIIVNDDGSDVDEYEIEIDEYEDEDDEVIPERIVSIEDLEKMMNEAIENEEYEIAAELRDRIQELKDKQ